MGTFNWSIWWRDWWNMWCIIICIGICPITRWSNILPILFIIRNLHKSTRSITCIWSEPGERIIFYVKTFIDFSYLDIIFLCIKESYINWFSFISAIIIFKLCETHSNYIHFCFSSSGTYFGIVVLNIHILIVSKCIFNISIMKSFIINELLSIKGNWNYYCVWHMSLWWSDIHISIGKVINFLLNSTISDCHITYTFLVETFSKKFWYCTTFHWSFIWSHTLNSRINIVNKLKSGIGVLLSIQCHWYIIEWWMLISKSHIRR